MQDINIVWNFILTFAAGGIGWWINGLVNKVEKIHNDFSSHKEEVAKVYATKFEVDNDLSKLMLRFDRLETKIDNLLARIISDNNK